MSESGWSNDQEQTTGTKRKLPGWVWGCGIGCLVILVLVVAGVWVGAKMLGKFVDQDAVWASIDEVLPVEETPDPEDYFALQIPFNPGGATMWVISATSGDRSIVLFSAPPGSEATKMRDGLLDATTEQSVGGPLGDYGRHDVVGGSISVQGRALECVRFSALPEEGGNALTGFANLEGSTVVVDLAPEGSERLLVMQFSNQGESEPVPDEHVQEFLDHFRVPGGDRGSASSEAPAVEAAEEEVQPEAPAEPVPAGEER